MGGWQCVVHAYKKLTMAPHLCLGIGKSCTVKLQFLHLKDKVNEKVPNQSASQSISGLIVQSKAGKSIRKAAKSCVIFHHEDFGGQLIWALPRYVTVDVQGPDEAFFAEEPQQPTPPTAGNAESAVHPSGTAQDNVTEFRQPLQVQSHLEMPGILVQLGHTQRT